MDIPTGSAAGIMSWQGKELYCEMTDRRPSGWTPHTGRVMVSFILLHLTLQPTMETMRRPSAFTRSSIRYYQQRHTRIKYPPQAKSIRSILVKTTISSPTLLPDSNLYNASTNALSCTTLPLLNIGGDIGIFMCSPSENAFLNNRSSQLDLPHQS